MIEAIAHLGLLDDEDIRLDLAALELSALDHPGVDLSPYVELLDAIEADLRAMPVAADDVMAQAAALAEVFAVRQGFTGDRNSYDAPVNADLIRVIDRRMGLPIALAILYVGQARRLGWSAHALNTPAHVMVRIGADEGAVVIDPFHEGAIVSRDTIVRLIRQALGPGASIDAQNMAPLSNRLALVRLLTNQVIRAEQGKDSARALMVQERIATVAPSYGQGWWDLARFQLADGQVEGARESLSAMLEVTRDPEMRAQVSAALEALAFR